MQISTERLSKKKLVMKFNIFDNDDRDCFKSSGLVRKNYHRDLNNDLHVMKIIFPPEFYYGSHYHKTRDELYILVKGTLEITRFTKDTIEVIKLSKTGNNSYLCLSPEHHSVRNPSKKKPAVVLEVRRGPFEPSDTVKLF